MLPYWEYKAGFRVEDSERLIDEVVRRSSSLHRAETAFMGTEIGEPDWSEAHRPILVLDPVFDFAETGSDAVSLLLRESHSVDEARTWARANALHVQMYDYTKAAYWIGADSLQYDSRITLIRDLSVAASQYQDAAQSLARQLRPMLSSFAIPATSQTTWSVTPVEETLYWYQSAAREATPNFRTALRTIALAALDALRRGVEAGFVFYFLDRRGGQTPREPNVSAGASVAAISAVEMLATTLMRHGPPRPFHRDSASNRSRADGLESNDRLILHLVSTAGSVEAGGPSLERHGIERRPHIRRRVAPYKSDSRRPREVSGEAVVRRSASARQEACRSGLHERRRGRGVPPRLRRPHRENRRKHVGIARVSVDTWRDSRTATSSAWCAAGRGLLGGARLLENAAADQGRNRCGRRNRGVVGREDEK